MVQIQMLEGLKLKALLVLMIMDIQHIAYVYIEFNDIIDPNNKYRRSRYIQYMQTIKDMNVIIMI